MLLWAGLLILFGLDPKAAGWPEGMGDCWQARWWFPSSEDFSWSTSLACALQRPHHCPTPWCPNCLKRDRDRVVHGWELVGCCRIDREFLCRCSRDERDSARVAGTRSLSWPLQLPWIVLPSLGAMVCPVNPPASWWRSGLAVLVVLGMLPVIGNSSETAVLSPAANGTARSCVSRRPSRWNWWGGMSPAATSAVPATGWRPTRKRRTHPGARRTRREPDRLGRCVFRPQAVVTNRINGNRWHVFGDQETALRHARGNPGSSDAG
ncbi:MAG: hypothetical protein CM1200mP2_51650 [Planctomycetaceae bacterium]|nr:MAG: hypothetical protein CM1200mP2_51650 [Planctomycetaceae bacterium]